MITTSTDYATIRYHAGIERSAALRALLNSARHYFQRKRAMRAEQSGDVRGMTTA